MLDTRLCGNTQAEERRPATLCVYDSAQVDVTMFKATGTSSLVHVVGISSSATAARMKPTNLLTANLFNGQMVNYFNMWDYKAAKMAFADGGQSLYGQGQHPSECCTCSPGTHIADETRIIHSAK